MASGVAARILDAPPPGWDALLRSDRGATPAHRPEVWAALAATLPGMEARFVAVERDQALLGGAAAMIQRRAGLHWVLALPFLLSGAPLAAADAREAVDAAVAEAIVRLQREVGAVGGQWALYRPAGPGIAAAALERPAGETRLVETSLIDFGGGIEAAWRLVDADARYELRRARALGLRFGEEPAALEEAYALHLAQSRRWRGHRPQPIELFRRLLAAHGGSAPAARLFVVRDARGVVAATLFLDHPRETFAWWSGAHPRARAQHAMPFLYWSAAEWACAAGRLRLNLGGSAGIEALAAFKRSLGARRFVYPVRWLDASHGTWLARAAAGVQERLRRGRHRGETA